MVFKTGQSPRQLQGFFITADYTDKKTQIAQIKDMDFFSEEKKKTVEVQPLALRMAPRTLGEFVGQEHILGEGKLLRRAIESDRTSSLILFGPPGSGKSALAKVIAKRTSAYFVEVNAVNVGVETIRQEIILALQRKEISQKKTILLVDEIHHFNKLQQDALLPDVEKGNITLIGITTENPYFYVNPGIISRSLVFEFCPLQEKDLEKIIKHTLTDEERGLGKMKFKMSKEAIKHLIQMAEGDARRVLNALEIGFLTTKPDKNGTTNFDLTVAEESIQKKAILYDRAGDEHYDTISAYIKSLRGSNPNAALYWLAKMLYAGEDPRFIARRLIIAASEDVGNADPQALTIATATLQAVEFVGMPEAKIPLAQATIYIACAPKSNASYLAIDRAWKEVEQKKTLPVPTHLKDAHLNGKDRLGHGVGYKYPHDYSGHYVEQEYLPEKMVFYEPTEMGFEKEIKRRMVNLTQNPDKEEIRNEIIRKRNELSKDEIAKKSQIIGEKLSSLSAFVKARTILFYVSFRNEVETHPLIERSLSLGKKVIVPRVNQEKKELELYEISSLEELTSGSWNIPEPDPKKAKMANLEEIDTVIVPGVVFDENGNRIGYGGGYYDRRLAVIRKIKKEKVRFIGLGFDFQVKKEIPQGMSDVKVDSLVTEKRLFSF